jgi:Protein of unknown function (DUF3822)
LSTENILQLDATKIIYANPNIESASKLLHLSISIQTDWVICSVLDLQLNKIVKISERPHHIPYAKENSQHSLKKILQEISEKHTFKSISVSLRNEYYTLVPSGIFDETTQRSFLELNHNIQFPELIKADFIYSLNSYAVHYFPENLYLDIISVFPTSRLFHHISILAEMLIRENKFSKSKNSYLFLDNENFDLVVFDKNKLLLCNNYKFQTKEDVLYFYLNSIEQLKLQLNEVQVYLMGKTENQTDLHEIFENYHPNPLQTVPIPYFEPLENASEALLPTYYTNLTQHLCVL